MFKKNIGYLATAFLLFSSPTALANDSSVSMSNDGENAAEVINEIYLYDGVPYDGVTSEDEVSGEVAPDTVDDGGFHQLFNEWEMNGYPDNIGYVIFSNELNKMVVGLLDNSPAAQEDILSSLTNRDAVAFEQATYSHNEMMAILDEMNAVYANDPDNVYGYGFGWAVIDGNITGFGPSGNELRITLEVTDAVHAQYVEEMNARYGDKVVVLVGIPVDPLDIVSTMEMGTTMENTAAVSEQTNYTTILIIGLIAFTSFVALYQRRQRPLKQTTNGTIVTGMDRKDVVEAIKEAEIKPSEDVYQSIQEKIK